MLASFQQACQIAQVASQANEPQWLLDRRQESADLYESLPYPKVERGKIARTFDLTSGYERKEHEVPANLLDQVKSSSSEEVAASITLFHNQLIHRELAPELAEAGVLLLTLEEAMKQQPKLIEQWLMTQTLPYQHDKYAALHQALMSSGVVVYLPKGVQIERAVQVHLIQDARTTSSYHPHILIVAEEQSAMQYMERLSSVGEAPSNATIVTEIITQPASRIQYAAIDSMGESITTYLRRNAYQLRDSQIDWAVGALNNGTTISDYNVDLHGEASQSEVKIVSITHGEQKHVIDTKVTNYANHSDGEIFQHGVVLDRSTLTMNGIGHIIKGSKDANSQQESRILMLSDESRGDANPILLIDEFEVQAGHAASVGQLDPVQLFYLMSRGLSRKQAERLVIRGFLGQVIQAIPLAEDREALIESIEQKLATLA